MPRWNAKTSRAVRSCRVRFCMVRSGDPRIDGAESDQKAGAEEHRAQADMAADEAAEERARDLSDEIRRRRITQRAADNGIGNAQPDDAGDARHQAAQ